MGIFGSKNKFKKTPEMPQNLPPIIPSNTQKTEDNNLAKMRRQLYHDAPTFILNNLLLSIQFFNNYEKDIADLRMSNISSKENKINTDLSKEQKHCLMPDTLHELIDTNVCFQPKHGAAKYYTETLHRQRILVAYDNIEVRNPSETAEYSSALDGPIYKCVIEGTELRGYVQLKLKEIEVKRKMSNPNNPEKIIEKKEIIKIDDNADEIVNEENNSDDVDGNESNLNDDVFVDSPTPLPNEKQSLIRQLSLSKQQMIIQKIPEESDYGYSTITNHYTAKPLKQVQIDTTDSGKASSSLTNIIRLPSNCITSVQVKVYRDKIEEEEEKRKLREKYPDKNEFRRQMMLRQKHKLYNKIVYLNSIAFHDYFGDTFPQYIGKKLGFTQKHIQFAVMQSAIIYIDVIDKETKHVTNYEVVPTVTSSWPDEAFEWSLRTRPVIQDAKTQTAYCWPTPGMISRVKSFPSYIYPIGFYPKRGENINRDLQWRLQFPVAERFLESHLHHAQVRCYLITLTYFKSFIESKDNKLGLTADHIRTHLFWECERDYVRWPENRLGEKMIVFLRNLQRHLAYRELPDYFIPTRNLFENIPENRLMIAHRKILDILENPVMYTLRALRNLKYRKDSFYPMLDYKRLYTILTSSNNNILQMINPILAMTNTELDESSSSGDELDPEQRWFRDAYRERQEEKEIEKKKKERKRRISSDSINTEIQPVRVMDTMQQMFVLKLFVEHFIEMARKSNEFNNPHQGLMYLQQAKNLNTLLNEMPSGQEDSIEYFSHISKVEELLKITLAQEENVPKLPSRKGQSQSYRNIKNTGIINEPKASTTSSNYVNVDEILEKSKLTEIENYEKLKEKHHFNTREEEQIKDTAVESQTEIGKHNKIDIDQNRKISEEKSFENVLIVQVDVHSSNKKQVTSNENNSDTLKFDDNEESGKNKKDVSKMNIAEKTKSVHDEIILNDDYITRLNSGSKNSVNEIENNSNQNNLGISDLNKEPNKTNSTKSSISLSKNPTVNEINKNQEEIAVSDDYLARLNYNKRTEVYQDIENNSRRKLPRKNVAPKDEHPNSSINEKFNEINQKIDENNKKHFEILNESNNSSILSSKTDTLSKIKRIQEEITLNDDYLAVLNSNKRKEEDNQDIVIENKSEKDILQKAPTKNDVYLTHLNSKSNENLNEIQQNINIETDQKNQNKTLIPQNTRQEVITLQDEYSSRLNYGNTKCLNESSPDDDVIIANKLDSRITLRSNSGQTRSNVNSIILREDSEEFECTEL